MMRRALALAARGLGRTSPNPAVGAVLCGPRRQVLATGWHKRAGLDHAEVAALRRLGFRAPGATLYVTLEPCDHQGRTPPCSQAIVRSGVRRVVVAMIDPHPLVAGRGVRRLRAAGLRVEVGLLESEARRLNEAWLHWLELGRPLVLLKLAETLDGKIATRSGDSRWVSGPEARALVHRMRDRFDAVLVGAGTIRADDPRLTTRGIQGGRGGRDPVRVILDRNLTTPPGARALPAIILTGRAADRRREAALERAGATVVRTRSLKDGLRALGRAGICSLLVEGGGETAGALLEAGCVDRVVMFIAPRIAGGREAVPAVGGRGVNRMADAIALERVRLRRVGQDVMITGDVHGARGSQRARRARDARRR